jgi:periplasmic protein TonB
VRKLLTLTALVMGLAGGLAAQDQVYEIGNGIKAPVLIREVKPGYTEGAMRRKVQGLVELDAVVLKDGTVGDTTIRRSLDEDLDQEAIKALKQWRFRPGTKDGEAVNVQVQVELTFTLRDKK